ncbi:hypothetical protein [Actinoallomurus sp. NPDC052274]|uniref:hypothetical protein n=1 Tax=Actinoallomurus sp. NPDC052274 TaxID=3155420 RepID=UPI0034457022
MTRDQAITEAAQLLTDACAEIDALPVEEVARAAHTPGGHTIAELVEMVRAQRAQARAVKVGGEAA